MQTTLLIGGTNYCPSARRFFGQLIESNIPFVYLPFDPKKKDKAEYWKSLHTFMSEGAARTFPAVMMLTGDKKKNWSKEGRYPSDQEIFNSITEIPDIRKKISKTLSTPAYSSRFYAITDSKQAWEHFNTDTAFIFRST
jgi:hypothetical protein